MQENSLLVAVMARIARRVADCRQVTSAELSGVELYGAASGEAGDGAKVVIVDERQLGDLAGRKVDGGRLRLLAAVEDGEQARSAFERGAEGVVDSGSLAEDLPLALDALRAGRPYLSPALATRMGCCPLVRRPDDARRH